MNDLPSAITILSAMITPAMLIVACGSIILATSQRLGRSLERTRKVVLEFEEKLAAPTERALLEEERSVLFDLLRRAVHRSRLLQRAMTLLYFALSAFVATSVAIGIVAVTGKVYAWLPILLGLVGASLLFWASLLLITESRIAMKAVDEEMNFVLRLEEEDAPDLLRKQTTGKSFLRRARALLP
jgi:hypothetical protein